MTPRDGELRTAAVNAQRHAVPGTSWASSAFPPIGDDGFLSDCETVALVAPGGGVEWLCLPRVDSPSVFGAMLDRDAGYFRLGRSGVTVPGARRYLPGTMVLETSWGTGSGGSSCATFCSSVDGTTSVNAHILTAALPLTLTPTTCCCAPFGVSTASSRASPMPRPRP